MSDMFQQSSNFNLSDALFFIDDQESQIDQNQEEQIDNQNGDRGTKKTDCNQLKLTGFDENQISQLLPSSSQYAPQLHFGGPENPNQPEAQEQKKQRPLEVFTERKIKLGKNNNVPKHYMKELISNFFQYEDCFDDNDLLLKQMKGFIAKQRKMYRQIKNWNNNLEAMNKIFGINLKSKDPRLRSFLTRKMGHNMIRNMIIPEIKQNNQIGNKFEYIFSLKVQLHRCRNVQLIKRFKSH